MRMTKCVGRCSSGTVLRNKAAADPFAAGGWPAVKSGIFGRVPVSSSRPGCLLGSYLLSNTMHHVLITSDTQMKRQKVYFTSSFN